MANEFAKARLAELKSDFNTQVALIADLQRRRTQLTGTGTARGKRVTVTVNADGTVIETKFTADVSDLSYSEIARAMTEAAQQAAAEVARKRTELMQPLTEVRARLPKLSEIVESMPDVTAHMPKAPEVSLAPPNSPERLAAEHDANANGVTGNGWSPAKPSSTVTNTEASAHPSSGVTGNGWSRTDAEKPPTTFTNVEEFIAPRRRGDTTEAGW
ncbi:YbaB/EbfC family nucleoid-associated protein [Nocardia alni]|uniref:YbaB/EbfC family nucleoid-associated protein n=1 Tax=Nocardia alni TaxID=2815723 RepID=UPI001C24FB60|nr:YbaB/EbfC family nucleoid-associated protein [Nocardia alni]